MHWYTIPPWCMCVCVCINGNWLERSWKDIKIYMQNIQEKIYWMRHTHWVSSTAYRLAKPIQSSAAALLIFSSSFLNSVSGVLFFPIWEKKEMKKKNTNFSSVFFSFLFREINFTSLNVCMTCQFVFFFHFFFFHSTHNWR